MRHSAHWTGTTTPRGTTATNAKSENNDMKSTSTPAATPVIEQDERPSKRARMDTEFRPHKSSGTMQQRGALATNASATVKTVDGVACVVDPMLANSDQYIVVVEAGEPQPRAAPVTVSVCHAVFCWARSTLHRRE